MPRRRCGHCEDKEDDPKIIQPYFLHWVDLKTIVSRGEGGGGGEQPEREIHRHRVTMSSMSFLTFRGRCIVMYSYD